MSSRWMLAPLVAALSLSVLAASAQAAPDAQSTQDRAAAANQLGLAQLRARDLKGAIASFSSAISLARDSLVYLNNRSLTYAALGNSRLALADAATARKIASSDPNLRAKQPQPVIIALAKAPPGANHLPGGGFDSDQPARIGLVAPRPPGQAVTRPANFDPGVWARAQYDGLGRDMSMTNAIQSRAVAAYQEQRAASLAEQARTSPEQ